jgi:hypothetical protein
VSIKILDGGKDRGRYEMKMKNQAFFAVTHIAVFIASLVVVFLVTGCKVHVDEGKFTDKPAAESAVLVNTRGKIRTGYVNIFSVDGKKKDDEGKSVIKSVIIGPYVKIIYLEPGEHTLNVNWYKGNSGTGTKDIKVTLSKGSITEIGFEQDGDSIYYLFRPLDKEQLNELSSFAGGKTKLLNDFNRKRLHLWKREQ